MATVTINGSALGTKLQTLLQADDIVPGAAPSYQLCKTIYAYHPLGAKIAELPVAIAQSQKRDIAIPKGPEDRLREAFEMEWERLQADQHIFNTVRLARAYGVTTIAMLTEGAESNTAIDYETLAKQRIAFNVFDPLNTAGSLVLNQDPNAIDFQKIPGGVRVAGQEYHRSRCIVMMNEDPLYIEYTTSAFGYVGRSIYQRALYPLKSFVQSMVTDDMVTKKAGLLIAMIKTAGSIIDNLMQAVGAKKRSLLKAAETDNVLEVGQDDKIETLNMMNLDGAYGMARQNVLNNIAAAVPMPALLLNEETFAEGFGEGTEDSKHVAQYIDKLRGQMQPLYEWFDGIVQRRAWNEEFYKTIQADFDDYKDVPYTRAFYDWTNSYKASWPSLLTEPPSELVKVDDIRLRAVVAMLEVLMGQLDPENKATLIMWGCDNFNQLKLLFGTQLNLDYEALASYVPPVPGFGEDDGAEPKPDKFAADSDEQHQRTARRISEFAAAVAALPPPSKRKPDGQGQLFLPIAGSGKRAAR